MYIYTYHKFSYRQAGREADLHNYRALHVDGLGGLKPLSNTAYKRKFFSCLEIRLPTEV